MRPHVPSHFLALVLFLASISDVTCLKYLGCFEEVDGRLFKDVQELNHRDLTVEKCIRICTSKGFRYVGLQYKIECYCSNTYPTSALKDDEECHSKCGGKEYQFCGGVIRLSVYDTEDTPPYKYLGCYKEIAVQNRLMKGLQVNRPHDLTISKCLSICKENRFRYAGLQDRQECFCANEKPTFANIAVDTECSSKCAGSDEKCGGSYRLSVYDSEEPFNVRYLGCYRERSIDDRLMKGLMKVFETDLTISKCQALCEANDFRYFALQWRIECFCSNSLPAPFYSAPETSCDHKCSGDTRENCGGHNRLSVYDTRDGHNYMGCFKDVSFENRTMKGSRKDYPKSLRTDTCIQYCKQNGFFKYAGTEYGAECYCSFDAPSYQLMAPDEDCSHPCSGDNNERCGGDFRLSVYNLGEPSNQVENQYLGCFAKSASIIKDSYILSHTLTADYCVGHCFIRGYLYAGVQNGNNCYCGDSYFTPNNYPDNECNVPCAGDRKTMCGGAQRVGLYKTLLTDESEKGRERGCYLDDSDKPALGAKTKEHRTGEKIEMYESNTPKRCMNICKVKGYLYAGVESGGICFCGDGLPPEDKKVIITQCKIPCPGDKDAHCGGLNKILILATSGGVVEPQVAIPQVAVLSTVNCRNSLTTVNGEKSCKGKVIFHDTFATDYDRRTWTREVYIPSDADEDFVYYTHEKENLQVINGKLQIKPTLVDDYEVRHGHLDLKRCTKFDKELCYKEAWTYRILPPIKTAQLTTRENFSFKYGKIFIRAKLPLGDWLFPELRLLPKENYYGPWFSSGRIVIALARGNKILRQNNKEIGISLVQSGFEMGPTNDIRGKFINQTRSEGWYRSLHNFTFTWHPDKMKIQIDDEPEIQIISSNPPLRERLQFYGDAQETWATGNNMAPFDREFYLQVGLSAGGRRVFPDRSVTGREWINKPWNNTEVKAMAAFFLQKDKWNSTWDEKQTSLEIDEIKITAI